MELAIRAKILLLFFVGTFIAMMLHEAVQSTILQLALLASFAATAIVAQLQAELLPTTTNPL